jgi:hypothetical protein
VAELLPDRHGERLGRLEAGAAFRHMPAEAFGVPVPGDAEQPDLAVLHGGDPGGVDRPHHVRRGGDDLAVVAVLAAGTGAMGHSIFIMLDTPSFRSRLEQMGVQSNRVQLTPNPRPPICPKPSHPGSPSAFVRKPNPRFSEPPPPAPGAGHAPRTA